MARNEEKQLGRLNRLWLQQLDEEHQKKNPQRPGLRSLHTATEVKKWLPSIKRDIDFYLKQSQVTCYPERQIEECTTKIEQLTREYKAYVRKLRELDPDIKEVPWTDRAYSRKRKSQEDHQQGVAEPQHEGKGLHPLETSSDSPASIRTNSKERLTLIQTPILEADDVYTGMYGLETPAEIIYNSDPNRENAPLDFRSQKHANQNNEHVNTSPLNCSIKRPESINQDRENTPLNFRSEKDANQNSEHVNTCSIKRTECFNPDREATHLELIDQSDAIEKTNDRGMKCSCAISNDYSSTNSERNCNSQSSKVMNKTQCSSSTMQTDLMQKEPASKSRSPERVNPPASLNLPYSDSSDKDT